MRKILALLAAVILLGTGVAWHYLGGDGEASPRVKLFGEPLGKFRTARVERGNLVVTVDATGTIEPEEVVDVGAQVAGMIRTFGRSPTDPDKSIDYGSTVEEGTILAQIDDSLYKAQAEQAEANLKKADADLLQAKTKLELSRRDRERVVSLTERHAASQADRDAAQAAVDTAESASVAADAAVAQAKANRNLAQINLAYTVIKSPVRGVIVDRRVNVGQTVVASLNAPSLFLIAKDLKRLQVWASVNEADIGHIRPRTPQEPGQTVRFTVDAYPNESFRGEVTQIRLNATMTQNVVTYTVVVDTENRDGKLLPYLTANLQFEVENRHDALLVPNAALRWRPRTNQIVRDANDGANTTATRSAGNPTHRSVTREPSDRAVVWVEDHGLVRPIQVQPGLTDGAMTEILDGDLPEGTEVVIGEQARESVDGTSNPFAPKMFRSSKTPQ